MRPLGCVSASLSSNKSSVSSELFTGRKWTVSGRRKSNGTPAVKKAVANRYVDQTPWVFIIHDESDGARSWATTGANPNWKNMVALFHHINNRPADRFILYFDPSLPVSRIDNVSDHRDEHCIRNSQPSAHIVENGPKPYGSKWENVREPAHQNGPVRTKYDSKHTHDQNRSPAEFRVVGQSSIWD